MKYRINSPDYDLYALNAEIEQFCHKHFFTNKQQHNILLLTEEALQIIQLNNGLNYRLSFSEKTGEIAIEFEFPSYRESVFNDESGSDMLSITIIRNLTTSIAESIGSDKLTRVKMVVKKL